jgi:hypothetical protein
MATAKKAPALSDQDLAELVALTKGADSVELKLTVPVTERSRGAAVVPDELPGELRGSPNFGVEVDAMPGGFVCSGSMKRALKTPMVRDAVFGNRPVRKLYSKEQRALYAAHAPDGLALDDLSILGPITVLKLKFAPEGYARRLVAELWFYPDNSMILELSTKCAPSEAFQVAAETRAFLSQRGVDLTGEQQTKTKKALQYFSKRLQADNN